MVMDKKALRERVSRKVEENRDDLVRILQKLVRTPSVNPPGDYNKISHLMTEYYSCGMCF
jgi:acetylornithine deacetylase/succinyl-diaminopimelate desuccinylase-like protein